VPVAAKAQTKRRVATVQSAGYTIL